MTALVGSAELPPKVAIHPRPDASFVHAMPAYLRGEAGDGSEDRVGMKWVAGYATNNERDLPAISAIVVLNDDGGGIFSLLEQGAPEHSGSFERVFGTPHGADLGSLCAGYGVPHALAGSRAEFRAAIRERGGLRVVEVRADRHARRGLHARLAEAVAATLADAG